MKNDTISMSEKRRSRTRKVVILLASIILLVIMATGVTIAYMFLDTNGVTNTFTAAGETNPTILESFVEKGYEKSNVRVDVGDLNYAVYVRAKVVINWSDEKGEVLAIIPSVEKGDYTITYDTTGKWFYCSSDGFWYYKSPVTDDNTTALVELCRPQKPAPISGYTLQVDILTQTIQAAGTTSDGTPAVTDAWGIGVDKDGNLVVPSSSGDEPSGQ